VAIVMAAGHRLWRRNTLRRIGLRLGGFARGLVLGALGIAVMLPLVLWVTSGTGLLWQLVHYEHPRAHDMLRAMAATADPGVLALFWLSVTVATPLAEELLFRGHLQTLLRRALGSPWVAVVLASAAFAAIHPQWMVPPIFFLSLGLGYVYERTANLWSAIAMHSLFNAASTTLFMVFGPPV
jgi:membrane protease YdiL (CAAX protease family)